MLPKVTMFPKVKQTDSESSVAGLTSRKSYVHEKQIQHAKTNSSNHQLPVINLNRYGNGRVKKVAGLHVV